MYYGSKLGICGGNIISTMVFGIYILLKYIFIYKKNIFSNMWKEQPPPPKATIINNLKWKRKWPIIVEPKIHSFIYPVLVLFWFKWFDLLCFHVNYSHYHRMVYVRWKVITIYTGNTIILWILYALNVRIEEIFYNNLK